MIIKKTAGRMYAYCTQRNGCRSFVSLRSTRRHHKKCTRYSIFFFFFTTIVRHTIVQHKIPYTKFDFVWFKDLLFVRPVRARVLPVNFQAKSNFVQTLRADRRTELPPHYGLLQCETLKTTHLVSVVFFSCKFVISIRQTIQ